MSHTQERIKQRREYLQKKAEAYLTVTSVISLAVPTMLLAFALFIYAILQIVEQQPFISLIHIIVAVAIGTLSWLWLSIARQLHKQALHIPYIPPVTADTLPAEEVLVRGSEEPAQEQSQFLLRGTDGNAGMGERDLLRARIGEEKQER